MAEKQTLQQFGASIKAKHPEYKDMDDAALGKAVLAKYPQYGDMVAPDTPGLESGKSLPGVPGIAKPNLEKNIAGEVAGPVMAAQGGFDKLASMTPHQMPHSISDVGHEGVTALRNAGSGLISLASPLVHPIDAAISAARTLPPVAALQDMGHAINPKYEPSIFHQMAENAVAHPLESGEQLAGQLVGGKGISAVPKIGGALKAGGGAINDAVIGTPSEGLHGAEPGLTMAKRGIVGSSPASLTHSLSADIPTVAAEHRGIVAAAPATTKINTGPLISPPFDSGIAAGINPRTGAASPAQIGAASRTVNQLTHVPAPNGAPTPMMRDPNLTPLEATDLKSNIYARTNYDPSGKSNIANAGLKGAAHGLKTAVESAVPESISSGHDLHSLVQAKEILDPAARGQLGIPTSRSGLIDRAVTGIGTRTASGLYGAGDTIQAAAPFANIAGPSAATAALIQSLRQQKGQQQ